MTAPDASADLGRLEAILLGLFLACWALSLLASPACWRSPAACRWRSTATTAWRWRWAGGSASSTCSGPGGSRPVRRRFLLIYYLGPPAILDLLRAMAPLADQRAAPFVPLYAFGVFSILFLVPVTMKFPGLYGISVRKPLVRSLSCQGLSGVPRFYVLLGNVGLRDGGRMAENDPNYRLLFSHPRMVEDLLRGFIHEDWVARLDFADAGDG